MIWLVSAQECAEVRNNGANTPTIMTLIQLKMTRKLCDTSLVIYSHSTVVHEWEHGFNPHMCVMCVYLCQRLYICWCLPRCDIAEHMPMLPHWNTLPTGTRQVYWAFKVYWQNYFYYLSRIFIRLKYITMLPKISLGCLCFWFGSRILYCRSSFASLFLVYVGFLQCHMQFLPRLDS